MTQREVTVLDINLYQCDKHRLRTFVPGCPECEKEAERLAANSRPSLIDIVDMIARQYQCSLKEASEYLAEAVKGLDVGDSEHTE